MVYAEMIAAVGALGLMIGNIRVVLEADSGAKASPLLSGRRLSSTIELIDFLRRDMDGLLSAAGQVWVHGSQDAIDSANALVSHSVVLLGLGTSKGVARTALETAIRGQAWTVAQRDTLDEEIKRLAQLRRDFAALARRETGLPAVALFTSDVFPGQ